MKSNSPLEQKQLIKAGGETRIDWRCKVTQEGTAIVRMKVITEDDSDAMEMTFPVYVHGILKQMAWSRVIAPNKNSTAITVKVPAERRQSRHASKSATPQPSPAASLMPCPTSWNTPTAAPNKR